MVTSLKVVESTVEAGETQTYYDVVARIVNFTSTYPYPRRFSYKGCPLKLGNGIRCGLSKEVRREVCGHQVEAIDIYRFEVIIVDAVFGEVAPVRAMIWDSASIWLDIAASDFRSCTEQEQMDYLQAVALQGRKCKMICRVRHGELSVQVVSLVGEPTTVPLPLTLRTGARGIAAVRTEDLREFAAELLVQRLENLLQDFRSQAMICHKCL